MQKIRYKADDGSLLVRDNVVFALFVQAPLEEIGPAFKVAAERWLAEIPRDHIAWALVGTSSSEFKPIGPATLSRCLSRLKAGGTPRGDATYFVLQGPEEDNPGYRVEVLAHHTLPKTATGVLSSSFIEFRFPSEYFDAIGADAMVKLATAIAADVPYDSGYLSPAVSWSYESDLYAASKVIGPLGLRHPGLDIHFNGSSCYKIDKQCRGPYWLTLIGKGPLKKLDGVKALQGVLPKSVEVSQVGSGVMIRAGAVPQIGDTNRNDKVPALRQVASVLEPVIFFGDKAIETYFFNDDEDKFERWDRRLLD